MLRKIAGVSSIISAFLLIVVTFFTSIENAIIVLGCGGVIYLIGFGYKAMSSISESYIALCASIGMSAASVSFIAVDLLGIS